MEAYLLAGMAFGDESKGATCDALCRALPIDLVVRYNGGCQAAHHVVLANGRSHCFSQFGAGMLASSNVRTYLSRFVLVEPESMMREAEALSRLTDDVWGRTAVDARAVIVTPFHRRLNRLREASRGSGRHGSCGRGIGVAREFQIRCNDDDRVLRAGDLEDEHETRAKLSYLLLDLLPEMNRLEKELCGDQTPLTAHRAVLDETIHAYRRWPARIVDGLEPERRMVFEGAQGVMLDEKHGTAPHNTWTNTTFGNAETLLDEAGVEERTKIGCIRSYYTRHGEGPLPTEDSDLSIPERHNGGDGFQGKFRVGRFDMELFLKALSICGGVDGLAISHLDALNYLGETENSLAERLQGIAQVVMRGYGPTAKERELNVATFA